MPPKTKTKGDDENQQQQFTAQMDTQLRLLEALNGQLNEAVKSGSERKVNRCKKNMEMKLEDRFTRV